MYTVNAIKNNITLSIGIAIPFLMIVFVAGSVYLPGLFIKPHYNFLYISGDDSYYSYNSSGYQYAIQDGKLIRREIKKSSDQGYTPLPTETKIYVYDVAKDKSTEVSFEEAQNLILDSSVKSPDEFEVIYGNGSGGSFFPFFFGGTSDYNVRYIAGHNVSKKLNLHLNYGSYYNNFRFIGWIQ